VAQVGVAINGRTYQIACDDGQEEHLKQLAAYVDKRVAELIAAVGQVGDMRLLVMTALILADELSEMADDLGKMRAQHDGKSAEVRMSETVLASSLDTLARKLESIAERLESAP
jgi:cell division protein ZapA